MEQSGRLLIEGKCRFMALQDLINEATQPTFSIDDTTEHQLVDAVLGLLNDPNGEVKSVAVKT